MTDQEIDLLDQVLKSVDNKKSSVIRLTSSKSINGTTLRRVVGIVTSEKESSRLALFNNGEYVELKDEDRNDFFKVSALDWDLK